MNMAFEANALMSSVKNWRQGAYAVDGNFEQNVGRCIHSNPQADGEKWPFLRIYTFERYGIVSARIWNRADCCGTFPPFYF